MSYSLAVYRRSAISPFAASMDRWAAHGPGSDVVGRFNPRLAQYWQGDGIRKVWSDVAAEEILADRSIERLWLTADARWVLTVGAHGPCHYLTGAEAESWYVENGYGTEAARDTWVRVLAPR